MCPFAIWRLPIARYILQRRAGVSHVHELGVAWARAIHTDIDVDWHLLWDLHKYAFQSDEWLMYVATPRVTLVTLHLPFESWLYAINEVSSSALVARLCREGKCSSMTACLGILHPQGGLVNARSFVTWTRLRLAQVHELRSPVRIGKRLVL